MEAMEAILTRGSVRRFSEEPIETPVLQCLLRAAMQAPSAANQQPWHFMVVNRQDLLLGLSEVLPGGEWLTGAPVAILVCAHPGLERVPGMWVQDCAAATQNLLLAAHCKGLGGTWVGVHPDETRVEQVRLTLQIPDAIQPFALVALGHPAETAPTAERYFPRRVHWNRWLGKEEGPVRAAEGEEDTAYSLESWLKGVSYGEAGSRY